MFDQFQQQRYVDVLPTIVDYITYKCKWSSNYLSVTSIMKRIEILALVSGYESKLSQSNEVYNVLTFEPLACREDEDADWVRPEKESYLGVSRVCRLLRVSDTIHKTWMSNKNVTQGNILRLFVDVQQYGISEYVKDDEVHTHGVKSIADGKALVGDVRFDLQMVLQDMLEYTTIPKNILKYDLKDIKELFTNANKKQINLF